MGTWDIGPFDNDPAVDAVAALADGSFRMDQFRFDCGRGPLGTDEAESVIALAAVLNGHVPSEALAAALRYPFTLDDRRWIRRRASQALRPGTSELYDLWEDAGELDTWLAETRKYVA
ncbi:protein of unknown function [Corynebacterium appendicis CIP 107643]|uniref:DUF4259 domain-containing protein n=1 Tax=Corynebacterium appendicis CIP 107643 TaxID=1161099 RepID=A0A1N7IVA6_9CORY|nr:DUF4259 domain-containing protein [Corynebacterium appendicis]MCT1683824.1 DUF4259 domain-containing protein [Corynebacterium appendicis]MDK8624914.1 DUF4259 domain-containing protein [Corynebacterium appendicis]WJY61017.1 hypothetical protein CAPP_05480 [Corynebacterium appendicis CIP 107643]SIS40984.1 protein of unknown function [Corynebacterium appendicis CIP 107643]